MKWEEKIENKEWNTKMTKEKDDKNNVKQRKKRGERRKE